MDPNLAKNAARLVARELGAEIPEVAARGALSRQFVSLLEDVAGGLKGLRPHFPETQAALKEPVAALENKFLTQRNAIGKVLEPVMDKGLLPHLGLHGTSAESGVKIIASKSPSALDFATYARESGGKNVQHYLSEVGYAGETASSFASSTAIARGYKPGPIFVLNVDAAEKLGVSAKFPRPYGALEGDFLRGLMPKATTYKGTIYGVGPNNYDQIIAGTIEHGQLQRSVPIVDAINAEARQMLANGVPQQKVYADVHARGSVIEATKRLDLAHQAIMTWLRSGAR